MGAVGRFFLHDAGVRVLAGDDRLIITVDVREIVALTVEYAVFEPEQTLRVMQIIDLAFASGAANQVLFCDI